MPTFPATLNLADLDGTNGFRIFGIEETGFESGLGWSVDLIGDVNGDGLADVLFTNPGEAAGAGAAYVRFGAAGGFPAVSSVADLDGSNGFRIDGLMEGDFLGVDAVGIGDINGDGMADFAIGARAADNGAFANAGATYLFYGRTGAYPAALGAASADATISIPQADTFSGYALSGGGDVNADGIEDLILTSTEFDAAYVLFGKSGGPGNVDLAALNGSNGFKVTGDVTDSGTGGQAVSFIGDVNGDGVTDLAVGSKATETVSVIFGRAGIGSTGSIDTSSLDGSNGFQFDGMGLDDDVYNNWVAGAGDVNGDGVDDFIVGGEDGQVGAANGSAYVIYGSRNAFAATLSAHDISGVNGFVLDPLDPDAGGIGDGFSVSGAGDVNGDGFADLLVGATDSDSSGTTATGRVHVIFGGPALPATISLGALDGANGFTIESDTPSAVLGFDVGGGYDINGDGVSDIVVGAPEARRVSPGGEFVDQFGAISVIFGAKSSIDGGPMGETLDGTPGPDVINGLGGDDILNGLGADDMLDGGAGDDEVNGHAGFDTLIGRDGDDILDGGPNPAGQGDFLFGGPGDDTYHVDSGLDFVDEGVVFPEFGFGGTDTIISTADFYWDFYSIGEILRVSEDVVDPEGDGATIVGGIFDNQLIGHSGTDVLFGRGGSDTYRAGDGVDFISLSTLGVTDENAYEGVNGSNTVVVAPRVSGPFSYDIVFEFESGKDRLDVSAYAEANGFETGADVLARGVNVDFDGDGTFTGPNDSSYFILGDGLDYLYMVGTTLDEISADDFII